MLVVNKLGFNFDGFYSTFFFKSLHNNTKKLRLLFKSYLQGPQVTKSFYH